MCALNSSLYICSLWKLDILEISKFSCCWESSCSPWYPYQYSSLTYTCNPAAEELWFSVYWSWKRQSVNMHQTDARIFIWPTGGCNFGLFEENKQCRHLIWTELHSHGLPKCVGQYHASFCVRFHEYQFLLKSELQVNILACNGIEM